MTSREPGPSTPAQDDRLPAPSAERLLARASELDAARAATTPIDELRAAATEAGISAHAFDAALLELRQSEVPAPREEAGRAPRGFRRGLAAIAAVGVALGAILVLRDALPRAAVSETGVPMQSVVLGYRCIAPEEAAAIARSRLTDPENMIEVRDYQRMSVRATPEQYQRVLADFDEAARKRPGCDLTAGP